jgi:aminoglycoside 6'-N-acetyltransferase I
MIQMSIKTLIRQHINQTHQIKDYWGEYLLKDHLGNNSLKDNGYYFINSEDESNHFKQFYRDYELNIKEFIRDDLEGTKELFTQVFNAPPWKDNWINSDQAGTYLNELIENPVFRGFVAWDGPDMVAVCLGHRRSWWIGKEFFIDEFFVASECQGTGIGSNMLDIITDVLIHEGYTRLSLLTNKGIPAESFYLKKGFYNNYKRTVMVKELQ